MSYCCLFLPLVYCECTHNEEPETLYPNCESVTRAWQESGGGCLCRTTETWARERIHRVYLQQKTEKAKPSSDVRGKISLRLSIRVLFNGSGCMKTMLTCARMSHGSELNVWTVAGKEVLKYQGVLSVVRMFLFRLHYMWCLSWNRNNRRTFSESCLVSNGFMGSMIINYLIQFLKKYWKNVNILIRDTLLVQFYSCARKVDIISVLEIGR